MTDRDGNPIDGATVEVKAFTKDGNTFLAVQRLLRTTAGFVEFDFMPTA